MEGIDTRVSKRDPNFNAVKKPSWIKIKILQQCRPLAVPNGGQIREYKEYEQKK